MKFNCCREGEGIIVWRWSKERENFDFFIIRIIVMFIVILWSSNSWWSSAPITSHKTDHIMDPTQCRWIYQYRWWWSLHLKWSLYHIQKMIIIDHTQFRWIYQSPIYHYRHHHHHFTRLVITSWTTHNADEYINMVDDDRFI